MTLRKDSSVAARTKSSEPKPTKGERTRARLLQAAAKEFARQGFDAARISDIVARAEVSQPAFYLYFGSKEAAYAEVINQFRTRLRNAIRSARLPKDLEKDQVADRVRWSVTTLLDALADDRDLLEVGFYQALAAEDIKAELSEQIAANVAAEQADGFFRKDMPPAFFADCLIGIVERMARSKSTPSERQQQARFIAELLLNGLRVQPHS